jgi:hypothetical protein
VNPSLGDLNDVGKVRALRLMADVKSQNRLKGINSSDDSVRSSSFRA